jgi:hypothetical protein
MGVSETGGSQRYRKTNISRPIYRFSVIPPFLPDPYFYWWPRVSKQVLTTILKTGLDLFGYYSSFWGKTTLDSTPMVTTTLVLPRPRFEPMTAQFVALTRTCHLTDELWQTIMLQTEMDSDHLWILQIHCWVSIHLNYFGWLCAIHQTLLLPLSHPQLFIFFTEF